MTIFFETERLIARSFEHEDITAFARYRSDPEVARYQSWDAPFSAAMAARFVDAMKASTPGLPGEWYQIAIVPKASQEMIGDCAFHLLAEDARQAEIGFTLSRDYQGQGYMTEAIHGLLRYLFEMYNLHRIRANCDPENEASGRLMKRVGMRHEGHFLESLWFKGRYASENWYAILHREWIEQHEHGS